MASAGVTHNQARRRLDLGEFEGGDPNMRTRRQRDGLSACVPLASESHCDPEKRCRDRCGLRVRAIVLRVEEGDESYGEFGGAAVVGSPHGRRLPGDGDDRRVEVAAQPGKRRSSHVSSGGRRGSEVGARGERRANHRIFARRMAERRRPGLQADHRQTLSPNQPGRRGRRGHGKPS